VQERVSLFNFFCEVAFFRFCTIHKLLWSIRYQSIQLHAALFIVYLYQTDHLIPWNKFLFIGHQDLFSVITMRCYAKIIFMLSFYTSNRFLTSCREDCWEAQLFDLWRPQVCWHRKYCNYAIWGVRKDHCKYLFLFILFFALDLIGAF
jgi:hypothetical protein